MTILFEDEGGNELLFEWQKIAQEVVEGFLDFIQCPYEIEVNILLTTDDEIKELNNNFRHIDKATDVLSFPMIDFATPGDFDFLEEALQYFHPETGELLLGDIVISKDKVRTQALAYNHSEIREYAFLIVHSLLHLVGYDHIEDDERENMELLQEDILKKLAIFR